jgi:hypothetical protein
MLANSCTNCLYTLLCGFIFVTKCGSLCDFSKVSPFVVYYDYLIKYFTSSLAILVSLIEIVMCLQRYSVISQSKRLKFKKFIYIFPLLVLVSLATYLPRLFLYGVVKDSNNNYELIKTNFSRAFMGIFLEITMSVIRGPILIICIMVINILTALKFIKLIKLKRRLTEKKQTQTGNSINSFPFGLKTIKTYINIE